MHVARTAPAKINLMLSVGSALPPESAHAGYHPILSWFHAVSLADTVTVEPLRAGPSVYDIRWAPDAPRPSIIDWPLERDLAVRAHRALESLAGRELPVRLSLEKRIPVGGGLGGGSSDAAAALLAVREACALSVSDEQLRTIASTLGSDVAFFLDESSPPRPALVGNLGDAIERIDAIASTIVLIIPSFGCATSAVYKAFDEQRAKEARDYEIERALAGNKGRERTTGPREVMVRGRVERALKAGQLDTDDLFNDLAKPAFSVEPRLGTLATTISSICRTPAHITGSGSCLFVVPAPKKVEWTMDRVQRAITAAEPTAGPCIALAIDLT